MNDSPAVAAASTSSALRVAIGWALVGFPLLYGIIQTITKASSLFTG